MINDERYANMWYCRYALSDVKYFLKKQLNNETFLYKKVFEIKCKETTFHYLSKFFFSLPCNIILVPPVAFCPLRPPDEFGSSLWKPRRKWSDLIGTISNISLVLPSLIVLFLYLQLTHICAKRIKIVINLTKQYHYSIVNLAGTIV